MQERFFFSYGIICSEHEGRRTRFGAPFAAGGITLKSYVLAIVLTMFLSALFAFQNIGDVTVKFILWKWIFPQGVWEVVLFSAGAAIMWFFSLFSVFEIRSKHKKQLKEKDEKIAAIEQEKRAILDSVASKQAEEPAPVQEQKPETEAAEQ